MKEGKCSPLTARMLAMKIRHPFLLRFIGFLASIVIRWWMSTIRVKQVIWDDNPHPSPDPSKRYIYLVWHETVLVFSTFKLKVHILISQHADGQLITDAIELLGYKTVRGSSTRGGVTSLFNLVEVSKRTNLMVTPDGPTGPRRRLKPGVVLAASQTGLPLVPVGVGYVNAWRAKSWDRFAIPLPWSTVCCVGGKSISVPQQLNRKNREYYRQLIEDRLMEVTVAAEEWAEAIQGKNPHPREEILGRKSA